MIPGTAAASRGRHFAAPGSSALGQFNFIAGTYHWETGSYAAADIVDHDEWIGGSGLAIPGGGAAGAQIILAPLTTFLATCQWTMVIEMQLLDISSSTPGSTHRSNFFTESTSGDGFYISLQFWGEWDASCSDGVGFPFASDNAHAISTGNHKLAVTRIDDSIALSVDGNAYQEDTTACTLPQIGFPMVNFYLGGWSSYTEHAVNIRSLSLYDPVSNAALVTLSA